MACLRAREGGENSSGRPRSRSRGRGAPSDTGQNRRQTRSYLIASRAIHFGGAGEETARHLSKRLLYIVLTATLLVASAVAASLPAAAQLGGIGDNVTKTFCETTGQLELPGNCPLPTTPPRRPRRAAVVAVVAAESFPVAVVAVAHRRLRPLPLQPRAGPRACSGARARRRWRRWRRRRNPRRRHRPRRWWRRWRWRRQPSRWE